VDNELLEAFAQNGRCRTDQGETMPQRTRRRGSTLTAILLALNAAAHASTQAPTVVHVDLVDPSTRPDIKSMTIKADAQRVKAGPVEFDVSNDSKTLVHEMIVVAVARPDSPLPYDKKANRVIESKIDDLGEASDLEPGQKKTLRLVLKPGNYLLICNQPDHYKSGMKTDLLVTP
jgi:uncharacterized cupredoxin-like copper-binding protein